MSCLYFHSSYATTSLHSANLEVIRPSWESGIGHWLFVYGGIGTQRASAMAPMALQWNVLMPPHCPVDKHGEKLGITVWTGCAARRAARRWNCPPHSTGRTPDLCPGFGTTKSAPEAGVEHCPHPVDGTGEKGPAGTVGKGKGGGPDRWTAAGRKQGRTWTTEWPRKRPVFFPHSPPDIIYNMVISGF